MEYVIEIAADILDALVGTIFVAKINKMPQKSTKIWLIFFILCSALTIGFSYISSFSVLLIIIFTLLLEVESFHFCNSSIVKKIASPFLFTAATVLTSTLTAYIWALIGKSSIDNLLKYGTVLRAFFIMTQKIPLIVVCILMVKLLDRDSNIPMKQFVFYLLPPLFTVFILYLFVGIDLNCSIKEYYTYILLSVIGLIGVNFISIISYINNSENICLKYEINMLKRMSEMEQNKYAEINEIWGKLQATRHDFQEHLSYIKKLSANNNSELSDYIKTIEKQQSLTTKIIHTGNRAVDFVLGSKAEEYPDVVFIVTGRFEEIESISQLEIVSVIGNILQNAIEATEKTDDKIVEIRFKIKGNYQNIICSNTINESVLQSNPDLTTTKQGDLHGFGIQNILHIIERSNGLVEFYEDNNRFFVHCALPLKSESN